MNLGSLEYFSLETKYDQNMDIFRYGYLKLDIFIWLDAVYSSYSIVALKFNFFDSFLLQVTIIWSQEYF